LRFRVTRPLTFPRLRIGKAAAFTLAGFAATMVGLRPTQDVVAQGGTRSLTIQHAHTKEQETVTFKRFGSYDSAGLQKLNWLLRDWRQDEQTRMDPQLFDILWEVYRESGSSSAIHVVSAYRSPGTNAMLARRSRGVAKNSQHMSGRALDFAFPDVSVSRVRDIGLRLQSGGVGYYPNANNPWVHLDTGGVRHWPKVSRDHLVRLFPDERTVHIPRDGKPLAGFEAARSIIEARGGSVSSGYIDIAEGRATGKTLFQILFGGGDEDEGEGPAARGKKGRTAVAARSRNQQTAALAPEQINEGSAISFFAQNSANTSVAARPETPASQAAIRPRGGQRPTPIVEPKETEAPAKPAEAPKPVEPKREEAPKQIEVAALQPKTQPVPVTTAAKSDEDDKRRWVNIPLPQRRPAGIQTAALGPSLVNIPLPQARPTAFAAAPLQPDAEETKTDAEPAKPAEAARPVQVAAAAKPVSIPLPQARPAGLPSAITAGLRTTPAEAAPAPSAAIAYAPAAQPAQRIVPAAPVQAAAAPTAAPAAAAPSAADRKGMNSLISQVATEANPARGARVAPASVAAVAEVKTVTGRFEPAAPAKPDTSGFTGSVIRPMSAQGFKRND
jgi:uncharacterized protein YcbK (DUF882 family)